MKARVSSVPIMKINYVHVAWSKNIARNACKIQV